MSKDQIRSYILLHQNLPGYICVGYIFQEAYNNVPLSNSRQSHRKNQTVPEPGLFHTTDTLDYVVVLEGSIWLVTDEGEVRLDRGDTAVQQGTRHAWHNHAEVPATIAVVLLGARRSMPT